MTPLTQIVHFILLVSGNLFERPPKKTCWCSGRYYAVGKSVPAVEESSHAVGSLTFPDFTRHFLLALSETVDSLLRAILIQ